MSGVNDPQGAPELEAQGRAGAEVEAEEVARTESQLDAEAQGRAGAEVEAEEAARTESQLDAEALTDDALTGTFRVWQRRRGHRYSLDDVLTAYEALQLPFADGAPGRVLDLGCGIGSVLLAMAWGLPHSELTGVEAQGVSFALARRNVDRNDVAARVRLIRGDLRDLSLVPGRTGTAFPLVTGTPPYQPIGTATPSPDSQRTHARIEMRGGIEAYLEAGARALSPQGRMVVCAGAGAASRVLAGARRAGLRPLRFRHAVPRAGSKGPLFSVWTLAPRSLEDGSPELPGGAGDDAGELGALEAKPFVARTADGARTQAYRELRAFFGLPLSPAEPASP
jgi:tRNA1(Val) A37 N6-methylase TrmN6